MPKEIQKQTAIGFNTTTDLAGQKPTPQDIEGRPSPTEQLLKEYVAGTTTPFLGSIKKTLPEYIDDITREFGSKLYDQMMRDSDCDSALRILRLAVLSDGFRMEPAVNMPQPFENPSPEDVAKAKLAQDYCDFVKRRLDDMVVSIVDLAYEQLLGVATGNSIAEKIAKRIDFGTDVGKVGWQTIKVRPRNALAYVIDSWGNTLGVLAVQPDKALLSVPLETFIGDPEQSPMFIPKEKFVIFTHDGRHGQPGGNSVFRSAYNSWWAKIQNYVEYYNYLRRFGSGQIVGKTALLADPLTYKLNPDGSKMLDNQGNPQEITKEQALLCSLQQFMSCGVLAVPGGTEVDLLELTGNGEPFLNAFEYHGKQIHQSILTTSRASKEAQHGSKADTGEATDIMGLFVYWLKGKIGALYTKSLVAPLIEINFGADQLDLCPILSFVAAEKADKAELIAAYAGAGYTLHESQFPGIDSELGVPPRDLEMIAAEKKQAQDLQMAQASMMGSLYSPAGEGKDQPVRNQPPLQENPGDDVTA